MGIFQGAAEIGEGFITVIVFNAIIRVRPDIIAEEGYKKVSTTEVVVAGIVAFTVLAIAAPFLASSNPDGLEQITSLLVRNNIENTITLLFSDYAIPGMGKTGEIAAILIGFAAILILWFGAGKSTLFKHFKGILKPTSGEVLIKGEPVNKKNIMDVRKTVGVVFQDPDDQIFAPTVKQDIAFGPMNLGLPPEVIEKRVHEALELVHITGFEERAAHQVDKHIKKTHLRLPIVAQLLELLKDEGVPVNVKFTLEEAKDELLRVVK